MSYLYRFFSVILEVVVFTCRYYTVDLFVFVNIPIKHFKDDTLSVTGPGGNKDVCTSANTQLHYTQCAQLHNT